MKCFHFFWSNDEHQFILSVKRALMHAWKVLYETFKNGILDGLSLEEYWI